MEGLHLNRILDRLFIKCAFVFANLENQFGPDGEDVVSDEGRVYNLFLEILLKILIFYQIVIFD